MANQAIYISALNPRDLMRELLEIMRNENGDNCLSLSCMRAMNRHLVANLHKLLLPASLLDKIRAADNQAIQQYRKSKASVRNRRVLGEISNVIPRSVTDAGESHSGGPRNIDQSFYAAEENDPFVDESPPVQHELPPPPPNPLAQTSIRQSTRVSTPKDNSPQDTNSNLCPSQDVQPYQNIIANANYDTAVTLEELEQFFTVNEEPEPQTEPKPVTLADGSETEEATEPDTDTEIAAKGFKMIPKIVVTDSRDNIQAVDRIQPEKSADKTPDIPEYDFYRQNKAGDYYTATEEPHRLYAPSLRERREGLPPSWSARHMTRSQNSKSPCSQSPWVERAVSKPLAATKVKTRKRAHSAEPRTTRKRLRKPGGRRDDA